jgi:hypothetical protein
VRRRRNRLSDLHHIPPARAECDEDLLTPLASGEEAGDSFVEPTGVVHDGYGDTPMKIMVVFVAPKGQPLVTQVQ